MDTCAHGSRTWIRSLSVRLPHSAWFNIFISHDCERRTGRQPALSSLAARCTSRSQKPPPTSGCWTRRKDSRTAARVQFIRRARVDSSVVLAFDLDLGDVLAHGVLDK